jgi:hypothetical protein
VVEALERAAVGAANRAPEWREEAASAVRSSVEVFDDPSLRLGVWLEAVRLTALAGDAALLRSSRLAAAGRALAEQAPPATSAEMRAVLELLGQSPPPQPEAVLRRLDGLFPAGPAD